MHGQYLHAVCTHLDLAWGQAVFVLGGQLNIVQEGLKAGPGYAREVGNHGRKGIQVRGAGGAIFMWVCPRQHFRADSHHSLDIVENVGQ